MFSGRLGFADSGRSNAAERIAGALAEAGIAELVVALPNGSESAVAARRTDLPALLAGAAAGTVLRTPAGCTTMRIGPNEIGWQTVRENLAHRLETPGA